MEPSGIVSASDPSLILPNEPPTNEPSRDEVSSSSIPKNKADLEPQEDELKHRVTPSSEKKHHDNLSAHRKAPGIHRVLGKKNCSKHQKKENDAVTLSFLPSNQPTSSPVSHRNHDNDNHHKQNLHRGLAKGRPPSKFKDTAHGTAGNEPSFLEQGGENINGDAALSRPVAVYGDRAGVSGDPHETSMISTGMMGNGRMVTAVLVDDQDDTGNAPATLIVARPTRWTDWLCNRWVLILVATLLVLFAIIIAVVVLVVVEDPNEANDEIIRNATNMSSTTVYTPLQDRLRPYTLGGALLTENLALPQGQAYSWLLLHPNLDTMTINQTLQLFALATIYYATNGSHWKTTHWPVSNQWLQYNTKECEWGQQLFEEPSTGNGTNSSTSTSSNTITLEAMVCDDQGMYQQLWLEESEIQGQIPPEMMLLTSLNALRLNDNHLTSTIPTELYALSKLRFLDLHDNLLSGTISSYVSNLSRLKELELYVNMLTGTIPSEVGLLTTLREISFTSNLLTGALPDTIGQIGDGLGDLQLSSNVLSGTIPSAVGQLTNLVRLRLGANRFSGFLPTEIGAPNATLVDLSLSSNTMRGLIPSEIGQLIALKRLALNDNYWDGPLPSTLTNLTNMETLLLFNNKELFGTIPEKLCGNPFGTDWWNGLWVDCDRIACLCDSCNCYEEDES